MGMSRKGLAFLAGAAVCLAIGLSRGATFLGLATAFAAAGIYFLIRDRRENRES